MKGEGNRRRRTDENWLANGDYALLRETQLTAAFVFITMLGIQLPPPPPVPVQSPENAGVYSSIINYSLCKEAQVWVRAAGMWGCSCTLSPLGVSLGFGREDGEWVGGSIYASGLEERSEGVLFSQCTHGNTLCSISTLHCVSVMQYAQTSHNGFQFVME